MLWKGLVVRVYSYYSLDSVQRFLEEVTTPSVSITPTLVIPPRTEPTEGSAAGEETLLKKRDVYVLLGDLAQPLAHFKPVQDRGRVTRVRGESVILLPDGERTVPSRTLRFLPPLLLIKQRHVLRDASTVHPHVVDTVVSPDRTPIPLQETFVPR